MGRCWILGITVKQSFQIEIAMKKSYVALLRGINVGGQKKIKMADLRVLLEELGLEEVRTYIQSGNIIFKSTTANCTTLEAQIAKRIYDVYAFEVAVLVIGKKAFEDIRKNNSLLSKEDDQKNFYYVFLQDQPEQKLVAALEQEKYPNEVYMITKRCVYLSCLKGYGNAKCNNNFFERKLKVGATARNNRTVEKLLEMFSES